MENTKFIVDGPDCTGKSTICENLSKIYNIPVYHLTFLKDLESMENQFQAAQKLLRGKGGLLLDRYIFSNIAYGNVYHGGSYVKGYASFLNKDDFKGVHIVFTLPRSKEEYLEYFKTQYESREEMYAIDRAGEIYDEYQRLYDQYRVCRSLNVSRYDMFDVIKPEKFRNIRHEWNGKAFKGGN